MSSTISRSPTAALKSWAPGILAAGVFLLQVVPALRAGTLGYGWFRDELYYLDCASRLALGYVDHPALSVWLLALWKPVAQLLSALVGSPLAPWALRIPAAMAVAAAVGLTAATAGRLWGAREGGRWVPWLAGGAYAINLVALQAGTVWSMNAFDILLQAGALYLFAGLLLRPDAAAPGFRRSWMTFGVVLALGLANKISVLWLGAGFFVALLCLAPTRRLLRHPRRVPEPWLAGGLAFVGLLPFLLWNLQHDFAHLEFIRTATSVKYAGLSAATFLSGQLLSQNPFALPVWIAALIYVLWPGGRDRPEITASRGLVLVWLTACTVLALNGQSKVGYLTPTYPAVLAVGAVAWGHWLGRARRRGGALAIASTVTAVALAGSLAVGLTLSPLVLPVLGPKAYAEWTADLGIEQSNSEGKATAALPQHLADRRGWEDKARAVAQVWKDLPAADRRDAVVYVNNYGRAGALSVLGPRFGLDAPILSAHNNWFLWSRTWLDRAPEPRDGAVVITLGSRREDLEQSFETVTLAGTIGCDQCMPYEDDLPIFVSRGPRQPMAEFWPQLKNFS